MPEVPATEPKPRPGTDSLPPALPSGEPTPVEMAITGRSTEQRKLAAAQAREHLKNQTEATHRWQLLKKAKLQITKDVNLQKMTDVIQKEMEEHKDSFLTYDWAKDAAGKVNGAISSTDSKNKTHEEGKAAAEIVHQRVEQAQSLPDTERAGELERRGIAQASEKLNEILAKDVVAPLVKRLRAGEIVSPDDTQDLLRDVISKNRNNSDVKAEIDRFFGKNATEYKVEIKSFAEDLTDRAELVKNNIESFMEKHNLKIEEFDNYTTENIQKHVKIFLANSKWGPESSALNATDKFVAWARGIGWLSPTAAAIAFSSGTYILQGGARVGAKALLAVPLAGAGAGGIVRGIRHSAEMREERKVHVAQRVYGENTQGAYHEQMQKHDYNIVSASQLLDGDREEIVDDKANKPILEALGNYAEKPDTRGLRQLLNIPLDNKLAQEAVVRRITEINSRLDYSTKRRAEAAKHKNASKKRRIDLISYDGTDKIKQGQLELLREVVKAKQALVASGMTEEQIANLENQFAIKWNKAFAENKHEKDIGFLGNQVSESAKHAVVGGAVGFGIGIIFQEGATEAARYLLGHHVNSTLGEQWAHDATKALHDRFPKMGVFQQRLTDLRGGKGSIDLDHLKADVDGDSVTLKDLGGHSLGTATLTQDGSLSQLTVSDNVGQGTNKDAILKLLDQNHYKVDESALHSIPHYEMSDVAKALKSGKFDFGNLHGTIDQNGNVLIKGLSQDIHGTYIDGHLQLLNVPDGNLSTELAEQLKAQNLTLDHGVVVPGHMVQSDGYSSGAPIERAKDYFQKMLEPANRANWDRSHQYEFYHRVTDGKIDLDASHVIQGEGKYEILITPDDKANTAHQVLKVAIDGDKHVRLSPDDPARAFFEVKDGHVNQLAKLVEVAKVNPDDGTRTILSTSVGQGQSLDQLPSVHGKDILSTSPTQTMVESHQTNYDLSIPQYAHDKDLWIFNAVPQEGEAPIPAIAIVPPGKQRFVETNQAERPTENIQKRERRAPEISTVNRPNYLEKKAALQTLLAIEYPTSKQIEERAALAREIAIYEENEEENTMDAAVMTHPPLHLTEGEWEVLKNDVENEDNFASLQKAKETLDRLSQSGKLSASDPFMTAYPYIWQQVGHGPRFTKESDQLFRGYLMVETADMPKAIQVLERIAMRRQKEGLPTNYKWLLSSDKSVTTAKDYQPESIGKYGALLATDGRIDLYADSPEEIQQILKELASEDEWTQFEINRNQANGGDAATVKRPGTDIFEQSGAPWKSLNYNPDPGYSETRFAAQLAEEKPKRKPARTRTPRAERSAVESAAAAAEEAEFALEDDDDNIFSTSQPENDDTQVDQARATFEHGLGQMELRGKVRQLDEALSKQLENERGDIYENDMDPDSFARFLVGHANFDGFTVDTLEPTELSKEGDTIRLKGKVRTERGVEANYRVDFTGQGKPEAEAIATGNDLTPDEKRLIEDRLKSLPNRRMQFGEWYLDGFENVSPPGSATQAGIISAKGNFRLKFVRGRVPETEAELAPATSASQPAPTSAPQAAEPTAPKPAGVTYEPGMTPEEIKNREVAQIIDVQKGKPLSVTLDDNTTQVLQGDEYDIDAATQSIVFKDQSIPLSRINNVSTPENSMAFWRRGQFKPEEPPQTPQEPPNDLPPPQPVRKRGPRSPRGQAPEGAQLEETSPKERLDQISEGNTAEISEPRDTYEQLSQVLTKFIPEADSDEVNLFLDQYNNLAGAENVADQRTAIQTLQGHAGELLNTLKGKRGKKDTATRQLAQQVRQIASQMEQELPSTQPLNAETQATIPDAEEQAQLQSVEWYRNAKPEFKEEYDRRLKTIELESWEQALEIAKGIDPDSFVQTEQELTATPTKQQESAEDGDTEGGIGAKPEEPPPPAPAAAAAAEPEPETDISEDIVRSASTMTDDEYGRFRSTLSPARAARLDQFISDGVTTGTALARREPDDIIEGEATPLPPVPAALQDAESSLEQADFDTAPLSPLGNSFRDVFKRYHPNHTEAGIPSDVKREVIQLSEDLDPKKKVEVLEHIRTLARQLESRNKPQANKKATETQRMNQTLARDLFAIADGELRNHVELPEEILQV